MSHRPTQVRAVLDVDDSLGSMSWKRGLVAIATVCLVGGSLTACGGEDDTDGRSDRATEGATIDPQEARKRAVRTEKCTAEVTTTGAYEADWKGRATVRTGGNAADDTGPEAVYTLTAEGNSVALYSPGSEFKGSVTLSVGETAYASDPADAASLDIDPDGSSASVDVTLTSIEGDSLDLVADFTCDQGTRGTKSQGKSPRDEDEE